MNLSLAQMFLAQHGTEMQREETGEAGSKSSHLTQTPWGRLSLPPLPDAPAQHLSQPFLFLPQRFPGCSVTSFG